MARGKRNLNARFHGKRLLVVEDHSSVGEILINLLKHYCDPSHANSGKQALEQIKRNPPDVILLDLCLPDMSGLDVARRLRRSQNTIPILAMSATPLDRKKCLQVGCNDFLLKPFSISTLLARLSGLIHAE